MCEAMTLLICLLDCLTAVSWPEGYAQSFSRSHVDEYAAFLDILRVIMKQTLSKHCCHPQPGGEQGKGGSRSTPVRVHRWRGAAA